MTELVIYSFLTACVSAFLDYCMEEGEVFDFYRPYIERFKLYKPLGGCVICMNSWLSIVSFIFTGLSVVWLVPYIGLSFVFLQAILKIEE